MRGACDTTAALRLLRTAYTYEYHTHDTTVLLVLSNCNLIRTCNENLPIRTRGTTYIHAKKMDKRRNPRCRTTCKYLVLYTRYLVQVWKTTYPAKHMKDVPGGERKEPVSQSWNQIKPGLMFLPANTQHPTQNTEVLQVPTTRYMMLHLTINTKWSSVRALSSLTPGLQTINHGTEILIYTYTCVISKRATVLL